MTKTKYILGGGISGLIFAYYNPEFTIISPDIGGQLTHGIYKMTWVHDTPDTRKLIKDVGLKIKPTKSQIGYYYNKNVCSDCTPDANEKIIKKKMSDWNNNTSDFKIVDKTLSVPENYISTLKTDFGDIIKVLASKVNVINDYITKITTDKIYGQSGEYDYSELVSTMPATIFWDAYQTENKPVLHSTPVTFIISKNHPKWYNHKYELIYIAEDYYYTRISYRGEKYYIYEFTGIMPNDIFESKYKYKTEKYFINKSGRIHSADNKSPQSNINFLGRFAVWGHSSKIQDVINYSINYKKYAQS